MEAAFKDVFDKGYESLLIIGSDCFELTTNNIEDAFSKLEKNDIVIGPSNDGGYYLLGMKKLFPFIFKNKEWSTESVLNETILELKHNNISYRTFAYSRVLIQKKIGWPQKNMRDDCTN